MSFSKAFVVTGFGVLSVLALSACGIPGPDTAPAAGQEYHAPDVAEAPWISDNGDGTYTNPILYADYPDPDIIRVGEDFYFSTTTFVNVPGLTILHSKDLVNWKRITHVVDHLEGMEQYDLQNGDAYRYGLFASSLRYRDGVFYIAVTPVGLNTRIYYSRSIEGPWEYHELDREAFDPGLFFEEDGSPYLATSINYDGTLTLLKLSDDLSTVLDAQEVYFNDGAEGSKIVLVGEYYYLFQAVPRRLGLVVSRAKSLYGPWETRDQIDDTTGGHQGAIVDMPDGSWYGFVMIDAGSIGRMTNISPIHWEDDWPVWGTPDAPAQVPETSVKPIKGYPVTIPDASDDFGTPELGLQWQWNHNPDPSRWSLSERPGWLRLNATQSDGFWHARNTLTQKTQGPRSRAVVKLDVSAVGPSGRCGFGTLGKYSSLLSVSSGEGGPVLSMSVIESTEEGPVEEVRMQGAQVPAGDLYLRMDLDFETDTGHLHYSGDGERWTEAGGDFPLMFDWRTGTFQGEQFALFCYGAGDDAGYMDVDWFRLTGYDPLAD